MITKIFKAKFLSILLILTLLLPCLVTAPVMAAVSYPYDAGSTEVSSALDYLSGQQGIDGSIGNFSDSAWAVMAIAAAGEDPHDWKDGANPSIVEYLAADASSASSANDYSRTILAITAADEDPTNFGGRNFLSLLKATYDGTQIGNIALLNDDFWGVMALVAAGEDLTSAAIQNSVSFILANQNIDGGWSWGVGADSDVDDTAAAIMALIAAGKLAGSAPITNALAYIKSTQMDNGGFESWGSTNADTDAWGIAAIVAAGQDPISTGWKSSGNDPVDDLLIFQQGGGADDGAFYWQIGDPGFSVVKTTACAITALLGKPFPVSTSEGGVTVDVRIEGENDTVWSGTVTVAESTIIDSEGGSHPFDQPTALGALDEASKAGAFGYTVHDFGWGLAITAIDGAGDWDNSPWWMFIVDGASAQVGADAFILNETSPPNPPHGEVLFALTYTFSEIPLKVEVDDITPDVGDNFTVTVTEYDDDTDTWLQTDSATVHADEDYTTGENGTVVIAIDSDMTLEVYAEKDGYIRSNRVTVTVGEGTAQPGGSQNVSLQADIIPAICFYVSPGSINFGTLGPRDTSAPATINLTNNGAWELLITAKVTDTAQNLYVDGIKLDNLNRDDFELTVARDKTEGCQATLTVPETYTLTGSQSGTLIFWAQEAP